MNFQALFSKKIQGASTTFWGIVSVIFLLSSLGLTVSLTTNRSTKQSGTTAAYTPGSTNIVDMSHYVSKFGFYQPGKTYSIPGSDFTRFKDMMPSVFLGVDKFNQSFGESVEPELIVWWSYAEGINGRVSFSNCNDNYYGIGNCYYPSSWQLGYGIQFSAIDLLKKAFTDTHGNPNNSTVVAKVGQNVLNIDMANHTSPHCGGFSCTFPQMTIDQIMNGVSTSRETQNNWWASVLSRDPAINSYMNAEALRVKRFNRQLAWGWGSYYRNNWQLYSDKLSTILKNWIALGGCTTRTNCYIAQPTNNSTNLGAVPTIPTPTPTVIPTPTPTQVFTPTQSPTVIPTSTPSPTPTIVVKTVIMATPTPTVIPTPTPTPTSVPTPEMVAFDQTIDNSSLAATIASPTTESSQFAYQNQVAPIGQIHPQPVVDIPTPTPLPVQYIAGLQISTVIESLSFLGIFFSILLIFPTSRRRIFFLYQTFKKRFNKEETGVNIIPTEEKEKPIQ